MASLVATLRHSSLIIQGQVVARSRTPQELKARGVAWTNTPGVAVVTIKRRKVFVNAARIITRQSGRKRHLSRYLTGFVDGVLVEFFLGVVKGARNALFKLARALQVGALKLFSKGMNPRQRADALFCY